MKYVDFVDVKMGTNSVPSFSAGNVLPLTARPFGMTSFALETRGNDILFYNPNDRTTTGIRLTHMPSPWINDYAQMVMMPQTGDVAEMGEGRRCSFRYDSAIMNPYHIRVRFLLYRSIMELVPTTRGAAGLLTYENKHETQRFSIFNGPQEASFTIIPEKRRIIGHTRANTGSVPSTFAQYFVFEFDKDFDMDKTVVKNNRNHYLSPLKPNLAEGLSMSVAFVKNGDTQVKFRFATSFVSIEQAQLNLNREIKGKSLLQLKEEARNEWEYYLSKIEIESNDFEQIKTFYSCMYRIFLFPRTFYEFDENDKMIHFSPADGRVHDGPMYTDNGFWDTYKTVYPLFSIILSEKYSEMCEGFLNFYKEAGWLPRWLSPGAVNCMPGTAIDAVFADAVAKGVVKDEQTIRLMLEGMLKHANEESMSGEYGREGISDYIKYHYVTSPHRESVNKTQDYAYGDFCISVIADHLGEKDLVEEYRRRSLYYRNLFDTNVGFMRARDENGKMRGDWTAFDWGGDYTEGGPWQNSFHVFHDIHGLAGMLGGREGMIRKMDKLFDTPPYYRAYGYLFEIHEMAEMAAVDFGQCAISNQPSFHIPYIFSCMGDVNKTAYWIRRLCRKLFNSGVNGFPGDEDNGSMAAWYVFSSMGFYPFCPGVGQYVLGSPAVGRCVIHTDTGKDFIIDTVSNTQDNVYYHKLYANDERYNKTFITHDFIKEGGSLKFHMTHTPHKFEFTDDDLPFSLTKMAYRV